MSDLISRQAAIDAIHEDADWLASQGSDWQVERMERDKSILKSLPSAEPERLTDDDFETIRIHLNAQKEKLCNQQRWKEAEEYQRIIDRFMAFASAQPERKKGKWIVCGDKHVCSECDEFALCDAYDVLETGEYQEELSDFCPTCGADMRGEQE